MNPQQVCLDAADYIERNGWVKEGYYSTADGGVTMMPDRREDDCAACAMGAIRIVTGVHMDTRENEPVYRLVRDELGRRGVHGRDISLIHEWNDEPGRSADDVISVLRAAGGAS